MRAARHVVEDLNPGDGYGDIQVSLEDNYTLVTMTGEMDLALAQELADTARDVIDRDAPVRIDASRVTFIDSTGLGFLAQIAVSERSAGRRPVLLGACQLIRESVGMVGIAQLLN